MAGAFSAVDLSQLPFPNAVEVLDYEALLALWVADYETRMLAVDPLFTLPPESDPAMKVLEVGAFRELLLRQRVNEAIKAVCLAYAIDADLQQIGGRYNVELLMIDAGDPNAVPPVPPTYESNEDFRRRIQLSFEGFSTAGPVGAYKFHGLGADGDVLDISVQRPTAGDILITVLSRVADGTAAPELVAAVEAVLSDEDVRPVNDTVIVQGAGIVNYSITAQLEVYSGPDMDLVKAVALAEVTKYTAECHRLGRNVTLSGINGALQRPGVHKVNLSAPVSEVVISKSQASWCTAITLTAVVVDE